MRIAEIMGAAPAVKSREKVNKAAHTYADRRDKAAARERAAQQRPPGPGRTAAVQAAQAAKQRAADSYNRQLQDAHASETASR